MPYDDDETEDSRGLPTPAQLLATDRASRAAWDRIPGEPDSAFEAFSGYLSHPSSKVSDYIRARSLPASTQGLASRWSWKARRGAYEAVLRAEALQAAREAARGHGEAHAEALATLRTIAMDSLLDLAARGQKMNFREAMAAIKLAVEGERLAAGEDTSRVGVDLSASSPEDLAVVARILEAAEKASRG